MLFKIHRFLGSLSILKFAIENFAHFITLSSIILWYSHLLLASRNTILPSYSKYYIDNYSLLSAGRVGFPSFPFIQALIER